MSAAFTNDSQWVVSGSKDTGIQFWNPLTGDAVTRINAHTKPSKPRADQTSSHCTNRNDVDLVNQLDIGRVNNLFATVSVDKSLKIWRQVPRIWIFGQGEH